MDRDRTIKALGLWAAILYAHMRHDPRLVNGWGGNDATVFACSACQIREEY